MNLLISCQWAKEGIDFSIILELVGKQYNHVAQNHLLLVLGTMSLCVNWIEVSYLFSSSTLYAGIFHHMVISWNIMWYIIT